MTKSLIRSTTLVLACAWAAMNLAGARAAAAQTANPDAVVLADFKKRIEEYVSLRNRLAKGEAKQKETADPGRIRQAQQAQAARIREARKDAKPGDIFTPEVRAKFRELMYPQVQGKEGAKTKAEMKEDAPDRVPLKVNAGYPEGAPLPTVPPNVLASLPRLPEELEYRVIHKDLILRDVNANIIVDFIPDAIQ